MALKHAVTATGTDDNTKQVSVTAWNDAHTIDSNGLDFPTGTLPAAPAANNTRVFAKNLGGRIMPAFMGPSGLDATLQPHIARNGILQYTLTFNAVTIVSNGGPAPTATGTATAANYATTSLHTRCKRLDYLVTTAATTAVAGYRVATAFFRTTEGFHFINRFCPATGTATATRRCFVGMQASVAAPTDVQPSTLLNMVGVGYDAADTNFQVFTNAGTGTASKTDTGIARPTADRADIYSCMIFARPGGTTVGVTLIRESDGVRFDTSLTANLPTATTALTPNCYSSVGGTSSVIGLTTFGLYVETDN